jgi:hypothetical protein
MPSLQPILAAALASAVLASAAHATATCAGDNAHVTLTGKVALRWDGRAGKHLRYPVLALDRPLCFRSHEMGDVPAATRVALLAPTAEANRKLIRRKGQRVTMSGVLSHGVTTDQPPEDLMLDLSDASDRK